MISVQRLLLGVKRPSEITVLNMQERPQKIDCECPLFPIAVIQIAYISPKPPAANGHKRPVQYLVAEVPVGQRWELLFGVIFVF